MCQFVTANEPPIWRETSLPSGTLRPDPVALGLNGVCGRPPLWLAGDPIRRAWRPSGRLRRRLSPLSLLLGQRDQSGVFFGEHFVEDPAGRGVDARIGDLAVPLVELGVEIV